MKKSILLLAILAAGCRAQRIVTQADLDKLDCNAANVQCMKPADPIVADYVLDQASHAGIEHLRYVLKKYGMTAHLHVDAPSTSVVVYKQGQIFLQVWNYGMDLNESAESVARQITQEMLREALPTEMDLP